MISDAFDGLEVITVKQPETVAALAVGGNGVALRRRKHRRHYGFAHPIISEVDEVKTAPNCVRWAVTKLCHHLWSWLNVTVD
jgi:hypothetical protein